MNTLKKLKEIANSAIPEPWKAGGRVDDAQFIATFNPQAVLALLDALERSYALLSNGATGGEITRDYCKGVLTEFDVDLKKAIGK